MRQLASQVRLQGEIGRKRQLWAEMAVPKAQRSVVCPTSPWCQNIQAFFTSWKTVAEPLSLTSSSVNLYQWHWH